MAIPNQQARKGDSMAAPEKVRALVERFEYNIDAYKRGKYNEYEKSDDKVTPVTVHVVTRQQITYRLKTGRLVLYE